MWRRLKQVLSEQTIIILIIVLIDHRAAKSSESASGLLQRTDFHPKFGRLGPLGLFKRRSLLKKN